MAVQSSEEDGWSSLPADLVIRVADLLLATNDLDCYMNLRAVCHGWRCATTDTWSNQHRDRRFRPTRWLMLKEEGGHADESSASSSSSSSSPGHIFFNVTNGRIIRLSRLPQLIRDYILISATTCGLLVLAARDCPHAVRVLNPITGSWTCFKVRVPPGTLPTNSLASAAMVGSPSSPTLVLAISSDRWSSSAVTVYWADRRSKSFSVETRNGKRRCSPTMLPLIAAGRCAAAAHRESASGRRPPPPPSSSSNNAADATPINIFHLLASTDDYYCCDTVELAGGDMLAVLTRLVPRDLATIVFTVDSGGNVMERVEDIGSHALLIGSSGCLAVEADAFPAHIVEANCIYNIDFAADECRVYKFGRRTTSRRGHERAEWLLPSRRRRSLPDPIRRRLSGSLGHVLDYPQECSGWRCCWEIPGKATKLLKRALQVTFLVLMAVAGAVVVGIYIKKAIAGDLPEQQPHDTYY